MTPTSRAISSILSIYEVHNYPFWGRLYSLYYKKDIVSYRYNNFETVLSLMYSIT